MKSRFKANWEAKSPILIEGFKRKHLNHLFYHLGFSLGAEIGVATGKNSKSLLNHNPGLRLICVDPWTPYSANRDNRGVKEQKRNHDRAMEILKKCDVVFMKESSMDAVKKVKNASLDFVYIDGNHLYEYVIDDLREWSKKVRIGGIVSGHDYSSSENSGVVQAVNEFVGENKIERWFISHDQTPSFFWQKK